jgi:hypothetical protein
MVTICNEGINKIARISEECISVAPAKVEQPVIWTHTWTILGGSPLIKELGLCNIFKKTKYVPFVRRYHRFSLGKKSRFFRKMKIIGV